MVRVALQDCLERGDDFLRTLSRFTLGGPQFPWMKIHRRVSVESRRVEIVGILLYHLAHRFLVVEGELLQVCFRVVGKSFGERVDISAFDVRSTGSKTDRFLNSSVAFFLPAGISLQV